MRLLCSFSAFAMEMVSLLPRHVRGLCVWIEWCRQLGEVQDLVDDGLYVECLVFWDLCHGNDMLLSHLLDMYGQV